MDQGLDWRRWREVGATVQIARTEFSCVISISASLDRCPKAMFRHIDVRSSVAKRALEIPLPSFIWSAHASYLYGFVRLYHSFRNDYPTVPIRFAIVSITDTATMHDIAITESQEKRKGSLSAARLQ